MASKAKIPEGVKECPVSGSKVAGDSSDANLSTDGVSDGVSDGDQVESKKVKWAF